MLSIYINVPFCQSKCKYCNFFVLPVSDLPDSTNFIEKYYEAVQSQIKFFAKTFPKNEIKTIYFGGGTPLSLGKDNIKKIITQIKNKFNLENLEEISFELNPTPFDETIDFIKDINNSYKDFFRLRFSFGIQSFDDEVLTQSGRDYYFNYLVIFFRQLQKIKQSNNIFNFDFIAFGKFNKNKKGEDILRDAKRLEFFENFTASGFADSFSIYTLELFAGSRRFETRKQEIQDSKIQEDIYNEFEILKNIIGEYGYKRYEISNFSLAGKQSLHNMVYWNMGNYIGVGVGAHSFLKGEYKDIFLKKLGIEENIEKDSKAIRFETNKAWKELFDGIFFKQKDVKSISKKDFLLEEFFLGLRTTKGINNISKYKEILIKNYQEKLDEYQNQGFLEIIADNIKLTDSGLNVYNYIITSLIS